MYFVYCQGSHSKILANSENKLFTFYKVFEWLVERRVKSRNCQVLKVRVTMPGAVGATAQ